MKIKKLKELLIETADFNNIEPYAYTVNSLSTKFETELDVVEVTFDRLQSIENLIIYPPSLINDIDKAIGYNIQYSVSGEDTQFRRTNYTYLIKILKTVTNIIIETILKNDQTTSNLQQNVYCISSISKLGRLSADNQKRMIYKQIAKNHLPVGYRIHEIEFKYFNIDGIAITKNKLK